VYQFLLILKQFSLSYNKKFQGSGFFEAQCIFPKLLWEFHHICNFGVLGDKDELIRFWDQKIKGERHDQPEYGKKRAGADTSVTLRQVLSSVWLFRFLCCSIFTVRFVLLVPANWLVKKIMFLYQSWDWLEKVFSEMTCNVWSGMSTPYLTN